MSMMDEKIPPMLAVSGQVFDDPDWLYEIKWDGSRTLAFLSSTTRLQDRRLVDVSHQFPELMKLNKFIRANEAILDGELIVLKDNKPSYRSIMMRKHQQNKLKIDFMSKSYPAIFITWDILYVDGKELLNRPLIERKQMLNKFVNECSIMRISDFIFEHGKTLFEETDKKRLEGVMAKKADSKYYLGKRSSLWQKFKHHIVLNAVILGYRIDKTALVLGLYNEEDKLIHIGNVESGISQKELSSFLDVANDLKVNPEFYGLGINNVQWIMPLIVCKVKFMEWSENFKMRAPSFLEFALDVKPTECRFM
ncbi:ATP dependent DNA ligase [Thermoanaerobacterium thermosaccharolyticum DSM 571]|uniref:DNA ligase (ATP) n=1 Tax=Thermoanaerobacterium thermosaccharolyticum (strain ATCC 7956 / DSM 571 / NCIMB 9385 / NCA 3814 / NCTC 13789 / WDCM 00135 / 2032) TaxID=580327 RepID=D9TTK2_THETC|nr:ATP dependent DNA ligase [Thermoanaerobacterium thermosaccharolyticum DSM 571]